MTGNHQWTGSSFVSLLHDRLERQTRGGKKLKRSDLRHAVDEIFEAAVAAAARGQRVRFPVIGAMAWREVKARKAGMGTNPFTGQPMVIKSRPASRKPRWSFSKAVREAYARQARKAA